MASQRSYVGATTRSITGSASTFEFSRGETLVRCRGASQGVRGDPSSIGGDLDRIEDLVFAAVNTSDS
jgi:hypothetical protein